MDSIMTPSTAVKMDELVIEPSTGIQKVGAIVSEFGYPLLRLVAALAVVWFAGSASS
jgi:hypothetical protein